MTRTVADELNDLLSGTASYEAVPAELVVELAESLDGAITDALERWGLQQHPHVIRIPKARVTAAHDCGLRAAKSTPTISAEQSLAGNALDVAASLISVRGAHRGSGWRNALEVWRAADDTERLEELASLGDIERDELSERVDQGAESIATCFGPLEGGWWPRSQDRVSIAFADGRVVMSGVFDLFLGGGRSERPSVVIEVKAGKRWPGHAEDGRLYALLAAIRDSRAPEQVITVTAGDGAVVAEPVRASVLEAAHDRVVSCLDTVFEIATGSIPAASPGAGCTNCSVLPECTEGQVHLKRRRAEQAEQ